MRRWWGALAADWLQRAGAGGVGGPARDALLARSRALRGVRACAARCARARYTRTCSRRTSGTLGASIVDETTGGAVNLVWDNGT